MIEFYAVSNDAKFDCKRILPILSGNVEWLVFLSRIDMILFIISPYVDKAP
jgi:hypothetical protein